MITKLNSLLNMEQFMNTSWLVANFGAFYIGFKAKLLIMQSQFMGVDIEILKNIAVVIGIISSILFVLYNGSKFYQQVLETKVFKKKNGIKKLFK